MNPVTVSIIIINYNTFELTSNCIRSILSRETDLSYEIILVDNQSSERDPDEFKIKFPEITLIKSPVNLGFSKGNNLGIAQSKGEYILLLNSDTLLANKAITLSLYFLKENPHLAAVTARLEYPNGLVQHNCQRFPSIRYKLFELFRIQKLMNKSRGGKILFGSFFNYNAVAYPDWIWGTFFMFRKENLTLIKNKRLADDFFMYGEDVQWCMDFRRIGLKVAFVPEGRVIHYMEASGGQKNKMMSRNMNIFMRQYYPAWKRIIIHFLNLMLTGRHAA
jgi:GT2 family glycosyltransferase